MSDVISLGGLRLGGAPKIAVPLTAGGRDELLARARGAAPLADLLEWRADCYPVFHPGQALDLLAGLRAEIGDMPLLFTHRSRAEGGEGVLDDGAYEELYTEVIGQGVADALDVELSRGEALCERLVALAHARGKAVVLSSHDFAATPPKEELLARLGRMRALGADLPKIAVMPSAPADVLTLLSVCEEFGRPIIAISMGEMGKISRLAAGLFGSAFTFASAGGAESAPGQMDAAELRRMLQEFY